MRMSKFKFVLNLIERDNVLTSASFFWNASLKGTLLDWAMGFYFSPRPLWVQLGFKLIETWLGLGLGFFGPRVLDRGLTILSN